MYTLSVFTAREHEQCTRIVCSLYTDLKLSVAAVVETWHDACDSLALVADCQSVVELL